MTYDVAIVDAAPTTLASVRKPVAKTEIVAAIRPLFDQIYGFLKGGPVASLGINVCVYRPLSADQVELEAGVQVSAPFTAEGAVSCSATPAGRAATTVHMGEYSGIGAAHDAVAAWCRANGHATTGLVWEVYGHWQDDPAKRQTDVYRLLG